MDRQGGVIKFLYAQLLHSSRDFDQTFTEALSSSAQAYIVSGLRFKHFWWNGPLFYELKTSPGFVALRH